MKAPRKAVRRVMVIYERRLYVRMIHDAWDAQDERDRLVLENIIEPAELTPVKPEDRN